MQPEMAISLLLNYLFVFQLEAFNLPGILGKRNIRESKNVWCVEIFKCSVELVSSLYVASGLLQDGREKLLDELHFTVIYQANVCPLEGRLTRMLPLQKEPVSNPEIFFGVFGLSIEFLKFFNQICLLDDVKQTF